MHGNMLWDGEGGEDGIGIKTCAMKHGSMYLDGEGRG